MMSPYILIPANWMFRKRAAFRDFLLNFICAIPEGELSV
jgi:hypothetical protein